MISPVEELLRRRQELLNGRPITWVERVYEYFPTRDTVIVWVALAFIASGGAALAFGLIFKICFG
jgi:hypothetical protein